MVNLKKLISLLSLFTLIAVVTGCGDGAKEVYGRITKINNSKITIETGTYKEPSRPSDQSKSERTEASDGSAAQSETPPAKLDGGEDGTPPSGEKPEGQPPDGEKGQGAPNGQRPEGMDGFTSDGGNASYILSGNIDITNLTEGVLVKLTLDKDTVTAIETVERKDGGQENDVTSETVTNTSAVYTVSGKEQSSDGEDYESEKANTSTVLVKNKGSLNLSGGTLTKSGDTTNDEKSNFYGLNAVALASGGSAVTLDGTTLTSSANGSNAIFATGKGSKIKANNFKVYTTGDSSRGLDATYGGKIIASGGDITTKGTHCAPIATDRGFGTIKVSNTAVSSEGAGSPCIYSTGAITATKVTGCATGSQIAVVEGKNKLVMKDCILQGAGKNGIMLYQSDSGDAAKGKASLKAVDSKLTTTSKGPMFYVTNTDASATLDSTTLYYSSGILANVAGNSTNHWGRKGENGGNFTLTGTNQSLQGNITCDEISTVSLRIKKNSTYKGAVDTRNVAKAASVSLDRSSSWELTGDSYVTSFTNKRRNCGNINSNGHMIYYDSDNEANSWLEGKELPLSGGGKLMPAS